MIYPKFPKKPAKSRIIKSFVTPKTNPKFTPNSPKTILGFLGCFWGNFWGHERLDFSLFWGFWGETLTGDVNMHT